MCLFTLSPTTTHAQSYAEKIAGEDIFTPWTLLGWCPEAWVGQYWGFGAAQYCYDGRASGVVVAPLFYGGAKESTLGLLLGTGATYTGELGGLQLSPFNIVERDATGLQIGLFNLTKDQMSGLQVGAINVVNDEFTGVQVGGFNIVTSGALYGAQFGGINIAGDALYGMQIGGVNWVNDELEGIQIGGANISVGMADALQIGGINWAQSGLHGIQIGAINVVTGGEFRGLQLGGFTVAADADGGAPLLVGLNAGLGLSRYHYLGARELLFGVYALSATVGYGNIGAPAGLQSSLTLGRAFITFWEGWFSLGLAAYGVKFILNNSGAEYVDLLTPAVVVKTGRLLLSVGVSWFRQVLNSAGPIPDFEFAMTLPLASDESVFVPALQATCTRVAEDENYCGFGMIWPGWTYVD